MGSAIEADQPGGTAGSMGVGTDNVAFESTRHTKLQHELVELSASSLRSEHMRIGAQTDIQHFVIDVELTNRCNASCDFCPRHLTPHQGLMTDAVFDQVLSRAVEFRTTLDAMQAGIVDLSFCGLGEATLHPRLPEFVQRAANAGFNPCMCSNGSLLTEKLTDRLLDAGLARLYLNVGDLGDDYNDIYGLDFDRLLVNVDRFIAKAEGRCTIWVVLVDHHMDDAHCEQVKTFWKERGIHWFYESPMLNRGGSIEHDTLTFHEHDEERAARALFANEEPAGCSAPMMCSFIGYDGRHYLCNSDWEKQEPVGSVHDRSILDAMREKLQRAASRANAICSTCNHDPLNQISRLRASGQSSEIQRDAVSVLSERAAMTGAFVERCEAIGTLGPERHRPLIPVRSL